MPDLSTRLCRWAGESERRCDGTVVTLGNFDGVHRAHRFMLERVIERAGDADLKPAVVTFEPTPMEFFRADKAPARLMTLVEKHALFAQVGLQVHVSVRFDGDIAQMAPEDFARRLLAQTLGARRVVVGHDFRFGRQRAGCVATLREVGAQEGFEVEEIAARYRGDLLISSTAVRRALAASDFALAEDLLGRRYSMSGRVIRGQQLGRTLGFATANLRPRRRVLPLEGIFAVRVSGSDELHDYPAIASLGTRPTVNGRGHLLEVHLFDFQGNLYGRRLRVDFIAKLRDEAKFSSLDAMTEQMHRDAHAARAVLGI